MAVLRFIRRTILWMFILVAIYMRVGAGSDVQPDPIIEKEREYYLYYTYLNHAEKTLYEEIYHHVSELKKEFEPSVKIRVKDVPDVFEAVFNDHPELFWLDTTYSYKYDNRDYCVRIMLSFNETTENINEAKARFEENANAIVEEASKLQNDFAKELYVHNKILSETEYDEAATMHQSAYSVLVNKKSVCAGYARAFQYLMNRLEIPTYYCMSLTEGHAWNIVQLDDGYYNVDLTWDDESDFSYMYFNCTDEELEDTHIRTGNSTRLPKCNAKKYAR